MSLFGIFGKNEERSVYSGVSVDISDENALKSLFNLGSSTHAGIPVSVATALEVPAVKSAVSFISGQIASLPIHVYKNTKKGSVKAEGDPLYEIVHKQVNVDYLTPFQWIKGEVFKLLLTGRAISFCERNALGELTNIWPLETDRVRVERINGRKHYKYTRDDGTTATYRADEVLDFVSELAPDGISHYSPIHLYRQTIALAIAADRYASSTFYNNGVPPMQLVKNGPASPAAMDNASRAIFDALKRASAEKKNILPMPDGYELKPIGFNPAEMQLLDLKRYLVVDVCRMFSLPPIFLQDLSTGTFSNTEQQGTMLVKHTLLPIVKLIEQELNVKLTGKKTYVEFNIDGIIRGDFLTQMEGFATAINNAILTPDEVRAMQNREPLPGGNLLRIQGANVPITSQSAITANDTTEPKDQTQ